VGTALRKMERGWCKELGATMRAAEEYIVLGSIENEDEDANIYLYSP